MSRLSVLAALIVLTAASRHAQTPPVSAQTSLQSASGLQLLVPAENAQPALRIVLPGQPTSDPTIEVLFPEHVTAVEHGSNAAEQLYMFRPGPQGERPSWRQGRDSLEYERDLPKGIHMLARATLENDGVLFHYEFTNRSAVAFDMIYAVTDPRLTSVFHDERLERTYVHHAGGFDLLASETPSRLTVPVNQWLPARYLASFTWPVPAQRVEHRGDGITYYNKSRQVDQPFMATLSVDGAWVVASVSRASGNVWSNPALTCQHVDPQTPLLAGQQVALQVKIFVLKGSLDEALQRAVRQRASLR